MRPWVCLSGSIFQWLAPTFRSGLPSLRLGFVDRVHLVRLPLHTSDATGPRGDRLSSLDGHPTMMDHDHEVPGSQQRLCGRQGDFWGRLASLDRPKDQNKPIGLSRTPAFYSDSRGMSGTFWGSHLSQKAFWCGWGRATRSSTPPDLLRIPKLSTSPDPPRLPILHASQSSLLCD